MRVSNEILKVLSGGRLTWSGSPTNERTSQRVHSRRQSSLSEDGSATSEGGFGDDFDQFEEGAQLSEGDDFGDFDDGFEEPQLAEEVTEHLTTFQDEPRRTLVSRQCLVSN